MSKISVSFFFEDVKFKIDKARVIPWVEATVKAENKKLKSINYIFGSDRFLHGINVQALNHDTLTDVITFSYGDEGIIEGEVYISLDRVLDNAKTFNKEAYNELLRVIIHGVLHLCGYNDKSEGEEKIMRQKEDFYLARY